MNVPYQVGETVDITLRGAVIRDVDINYLDLRLPDGEEICVDPATQGIEVRRSIPAEGMPEPGDVWQDGHGGLWFAVQKRDRYDNTRVCLTGGGDGTCEVEQVHRDHVLVKRLFRAESAPDHGLSEAAAAELVAAVDGAR